MQKFPLYQATPVNPIFSQKDGHLLVTKKQQIGIGLETPYLSGLAPCQGESVSFLVIYGLILSSQMSIFGVVSCCEAQYLVIECFFSLFAETSKYTKDISF